MKRILFTVCIIVLFYSCNDDDVQTPETLQSNFYALTVGNSWVYKNYRYDINTEIYEDTGVIDSVSIVGTEAINGSTYYKFRTWTTGNEEGIVFCNPNGEQFEYLRDSLGYLVRSDGAIKYSNNDYNERLLSESSWGNIYERLVEGTNALDVEAGIFDCINSERYAKDVDGELLPAVDRFYYSDGIGFIYGTSSFVSQSIPAVIRRLNSYSVN
ncbi:MAG: hypothetical protein AAF901_03355 [Bacteroidota bacterium]